MLMVIAVLLALVLAQANISVIFTGGVGKNGSTVAVRLLHSQPVVVVIYLLYVLDSLAISIICAYVCCVHVFIFLNFVYNLSF